MQCRLLLQKKKMSVYRYSNNYTDGRRVEGELSKDGLASTHLGITSLLSLNITQRRI